VPRQLKRFQVEETFFEFNYWKSYLRVFAGGSEPQFRAAVP
jgi:hypothetical protein